MEDYGNWSTFLYLEVWLWNDCGNLTLEDYGILNLERLLKICTLWNNYGLLDFVLLLNMHNKKAKSSSHSDKISKKNKEKKPQEIQVGMMLQDVYSRYRV